MNEIKEPNKKPLIYYYLIVILVIFLFNLLITPSMTSSKITTVDYGTFMDKIDDKTIDEVEIGDYEILYTLKGEETITGKEFIDILLKGEDEER